MITFKNAISEWEDPFGETMIGYSALTRKACINPEKIFVIVYWDTYSGANNYKSFNVGLQKIRGRWVVDENRFRMALYEKIKAMEECNRIKKTDIRIRYPVWFTE